jgi:hypothetical protein
MSVERNGYDLEVQMGIDRGTKQNGERLRRGRLPEITDNKRMLPESVEKKKPAEEPLSSRSRRGRGNYTAPPAIEGTSRTSSPS